MNFLFTSLETLTTSKKCSGSRIVILYRLCHLSLVDFLQCPLLIGFRQLYVHVLDGFRYDISNHAAGSCKSFHGQK
jgi:hypothetical protein